MTVNIIHEAALGRFFGLYRISTLVDYLLVKYGLLVLVEEYNRELVVTDNIIAALCEGVNCLVDCIGFNILKFLVPALEEAVCPAEALVSFCFLATKITLFL
ncbi:MAG: hypothetical protein MJ177_04700 [Clostridia bacterium]|nr:hypothetical protein [Clostridia bacterium]